MGALEPSNNPEYDGYARDGGYSSQEIDSDLEEQVLSHVYYGNRTYADAQKGGHNGVSIRTDSLETAKKSEAFEEDSESRYQEIGKANDRRAISGAQSADDRGEEDNTSSDASEPVVFDAGLTVNLDSGDDEINSMDESHESLVGANIPAGTGVNGNASGTLKKLQGPTLFDEDNDYDYLDNAGYMGKNRYYMEDEVIVCRKCRKEGHMAKDCTFVACTICGREGHLARECKHTGDVCHNCNRRGHHIADCPFPRNPRGSYCTRCASRYHHTDECSLIWRKYSYRTPPPKNSNKVTAYCYNCGLMGHFGDDCPRAHYTRTSYKDSTAFHMDADTASPFRKGTKVEDSGNSKYDDHGDNYYYVPSSPSYVGDGRHSPRYHNPYQPQRRRYRPAGAVAAGAARKRRR